MTPEIVYLGPLGAVSPPQFELERLQPWTVAIKTAITVVSTGAGSRFMVRDARGARGGRRSPAAGVKCPLRCGGRVALAIRLLTAHHGAWLVGSRQRAVISG